MRSWQLLQLKLFESASCPKFRERKSIRCVLTARRALPATTLATGRKSFAETSHRAKPDDARLADALPFSRAIRRLTAGAGRIL